MSQELNSESAGQPAAAVDTRGRAKKRKEAEEVGVFTRKLQQKTSVSPADCTTAGS